MMRYRPLVQHGPHRPGSALTLGGGAGWFAHVAVLERGRAAVTIPAGDLPPDACGRLTGMRPGLGGELPRRPAIMGILNVTPDSFSDGGQDAGVETALRMIRDGADVIDIGGESTRPGAVTVPADEEIARVVPAVTALRAAWPGPISIDTRKADVARAALTAGASLLNDVSALTWDPGMAAVMAASGGPVCLMHAQGNPDTMQNAPCYDDVVLDVCDWLAARIAVAIAAGIARDRIWIDPGIGFGKTMAHNLALLANLAVLHDLGCPILLGASRKGFIGRLSGATVPRDRMPGSVGVAIAAAAQGVQMVRVHDVAASRAALTLWQAATTGDVP